MNNNDIIKVMREVSMKITNFEVISDDILLKSICWQKEELLLPKGIILIVHGMAEHIRRYTEFALFLANNDFIVYGYDQRGHGLTSKSVEEIGYMNTANSFTSLADDLEKMLNFISNSNPNLPIYIIGHSMGSFVVQYFLMHKEHRLQGVILSGSNGNPGFVINFGILMANMILFFRGPKYRSKLMDNLIFGNFNKKYRLPKNFFNWLSRDEKVVKDYYEDEMCGALFTISFFKDFLKGLKHLSKNYHLISKDLPIYIISGSKDPVGKYGKGTTRLYKDLLKQNIQDVKMRLYPGGRHEILNEINKEEVYQNILEWLLSHNNSSK